MSVSECPNTRGVAKGPFAGDYAMIEWKYRVAVPGHIRVAGGCARYVDACEGLRINCENSNMPMIKLPVSLAEVDRSSDRLLQSLAVEDDLDLRMLRLTPF